MVSHSVADGRAVGLAIADAVQRTGMISAIRRPVPEPHAARSSGTLRQRLVRCRHRARIGLLPSEPRAEISPNGFRGPSGRIKVPEVRARGDEPLALPTAAAWVDLDLWDRRAEMLGGSGNSLFLGLVARLGWGMGRVDGAGRVVLVLPVGDRRAGDGRANALSVAKISVDPAAVTETSAHSARGGRCAGRGAECPTDLLASMALTPLHPGALLRRLEKVGGPFHSIVPPPQCLYAWITQQAPVAQTVRQDDQRHRLTGTVGDHELRSRCYV